MTGPGGGYDAGDAFLNIIPSFRGVDAAIRREAAKWGGIAGDEFDRGFQDRIRRSGDRTQLGPGPERSRQQGDDSAGAFGRAFTERLRAAMRAIPKVEVDADSTPAERTLQGLRRQIEELSTKRVGVDLDEAEAQRKLAGLRRELDDLARKSPTVNVRADTAAARAELDRLRMDIRRIPDVDIKISGALGKIAALRAAMRDVTKPASISLQVDTAPALDAIRTIGMAIAGLSAGSIGIPAAGGLAAMLGPILGVGGGAAGAGGIVANAEAQIQKANQARQAAQTTRATAAAKTFTGTPAQQAAQQAAAQNTVVEAQQKAAAAFAGLTPQEQALAKAQDSLTTSFQQWAHSLESVVLPVLTQAFKIARPLLDTIEPLVVSVSAALHPAIARLGRDLQSTGFDRFIVDIDQLVRPAIHTAVLVLENLGRAIGSFVEASRPLAGVVEHGLVQLSSALADAARGPGLTGFFRSLARLGPTFVDTIKSIAGAAASLIGVFVPFLRPLLRFTGFLADAIKFLSPLAPYIAAVVLAMKAWTAIQIAMEAVLPLLISEEAALNGVLAANPIGIVVLALAALVGGFILAYKHSETFRKIVQTVWHAVAAVAQWAWRNILKPVFEFIFLYYKTLWKIAVAAFHGIVAAWRAVASWFADRWRAFAGFASRIWHDITGGVTGAFRAMGGALRDAWHAVSGWLSDRWHAFAGVAARIWRGITGGIKSAFGSIEGFFVGVWHRVESIFAGAVNFVSQHIINPLIGLLDKVLGVFGVHIGKIPAIHIGAPSPGSVATATPGGHGVAGGTAYYAHGGREPGYAPGQDTRLVRVSPGEGFVVPEAVEALGRMMGVSGEAAINYLNEALSPRVRAARGGMRMRGGTPHFFLGGVLSAVGHALGSVVSGIRNVAADVAYAGLRTAEAPIRALLGGLAPGSFVARIANGIFDRINNAIRSFISGHAGENMASIGPSVGGAGTLAIFRNLMSMLHLTAAQAAGVMGNMWAESGFNPYIVQGGGTSMNPAAAGGGGYGLVQWTPGSKLIPLLHGQPPSIISEIRALGEQLAGSESSAGRALRAASTPEAAAAVFGLQYERYAGPPQAARSSEARAIYNRFAHLDSGGWLPPGATTVFNLTGQPELVLNPAQQRNLLNRPATQFEQNIYPQAGQSEYEIGNVAANAILFRLRTS
jgi:hypothetical protein